MALVDTLKEEEGFLGVPYDDADGQSIGYGTFLPITEYEATLLLQHRLDGIRAELTAAKPVDRHPEVVQDGLLMMAYQMGVPRLSKFAKMWAALEEGQYTKAKVEALDSAWAKQAPARARRVAAMIGAPDSLPEPQ